jgi:hypothetical protein
MSITPSQMGLIQKFEFEFLSRVTVLARLRDSMTSFQRKCVPSSSEGGQPIYHSEVISTSLTAPTSDEQFWAVVSFYAQLDLPVCIMKFCSTIFFRLRNILAGYSTVASES